MEITPKMTHLITYVAVWIGCLLPLSDGNALDGVMKPLNEGATPVLDSVKDNLIFVALGIIGAFFVIQGIGVLIKRVAGKKRPKSSGKVAPEEQVGDPMGLAEEAYA